MISPIRQSLFERAANLPAVSARELALMLCGLEPHLTTAAIPDDKHEYYDIFLHQIIRQIKSAGCFPPGRNSQTHSADEMFALAYLMIDEEITPKPVQERCLRAVATIAKRNKARDLLMQLGGQKFLESGLEVRRNQRGHACGANRRTLGTLRCRRRGRISGRSSSGQVRSRNAGVRILPRRGMRMRGRRKRVP